MLRSVDTNSDMDAATKGEYTFSCYSDEYRIPKYQN